MIGAEKHNSRYTGILFWGAVFLLIIYGNSLQVPFVFDDLHNIVERNDLHLTRLSPKTVTDTFFWERNDSSRLYRPISSLSFALNYYIGRLQVTGYHLVNIGIHLLAAFYLFKTILLLLSLDNAGVPKKDRAAVAALATMLWAAHPIQTEAVTYIVQRMTSLAALFYIIGLWAYLRCRLAFREKNSVAGARWLLIALVMFLAGILSKENGVLFPVGLVLLEIFFFNGLDRFRRRPILAIFLCGGLLLAPLLVSREFGFFRNLQGLISGYDLRPFTLKQRLLTEPRVFFFYISQLLYPDPTRFSLEHYFPLSHSLFSPPTTFWAIIGFAGLILLALGPGRRYPWLGFPVAFYFTHHLVEGTIIPLEIVYEHRNYMPSVFFFLPVGVILIRGIRSYEKRQSFISLMLKLFIPFILFSLGLSTHTRNMDWRSEASLFASAIRVAPEMSRPYKGLGHCYTWGKNRDLNKTMALYGLGVNGQQGNYIFERALLWVDIAKIYEEWRQWPNAIKALQNSLAIYQAVGKKRPDLINKATVKRQLGDIYFFLAHLASAFDPSEALAYIDRAIAYREPVSYDIDKALYQNLTGDYRGGLQTLRRIYKKAPRRWEIAFAMGHMYTFLGEYERGYRFYKRALDLARDRVPLSRYQSVFVYLAENRRLAGHEANSERYVNTYLMQSSLSTIMELKRKHTAPCPGRYPFVDTGATLQQLQDGMCRLAEKTIGK